MSYLFRAGLIYIQGEAKFYQKDHVGFYTYNSQDAKGRYLPTTTV